MRFSTGMLVVTAVALALAAIGPRAVCADAGSGAADVVARQVGPHLFPGAAGIPTP